MRLILLASILATGCISGNPIHAASPQATEFRIVSPSRFDVSPPLHLIEEGSASTHSTQVIVPSRSLPEEMVEPARSKRFGTHAQSVTADARGVTNIAVNFDGMNVADNSNTLAPASSDIGVSDQYVVQTVNLLMAVYDKTGNLLFGPIANDFIFNGFGGVCETYNTGFPLVLYDEDADRWLVSHVAWSSSTSGAHCIAVSETDDPRGPWYRYHFNISNVAVNNWPMMGVGNGAYYSAYNMFSTNYLGAIAGAFERDAMLDGDPSAQLLLFGPDPDRFSLMPFDIDGGFPASGVPGYFAETNPFFAANLIRIYEMNVDWSIPGNSTFSEIATLVPSPYDADLCTAVGEGCIPQPNGLALAEVSNRIMPRLQFREFTNHYSMVFNHTVDADGAGRAGIRWYELRDQDKNGTWSIYQEGTHAPADGLSRWMGSIAMDGDGNIALGYTASSSTQAPSIRYTARRSSTPLGQMGFPEEVIFSGVSQTGTARWGDYSNMATDADSFWFTHEYGSSAFSTFNWATRIAQIILNESPNPRNDSFVIDTDQTLNADVSFNDSDPDGDPLTFSLAASPSSGSLIFNSDGKFTYTPNLGFQGADSFSYSASDGRTSRQATVRIRVVDLVFADGFESQGLILP